MDQLQLDLKSAHPLLKIQILGVNKEGLEFSNSTITENRDLPWLQDRDDDQNGQSDVWFDSWNVNYRDVVILDGENASFGTYNVTSSDLAKPENYSALRDMLIDAAMATQKPWMNSNQPLDVNNDGFVHPLDVLLVVNKINAEGTGDLPPPTGIELPTTLYDCNGDNFISPLDVLQIINYLNLQSAAAGEGETECGDREVFAQADTRSLHESDQIAHGSPKAISPGLVDDSNDDWRWQLAVDRYFARSAEPLLKLHPVWESAADLAKG